MTAMPFIESMRPFEAVVAFVDILGFKDFVRRAFESEAGTLEAITDVLRVISRKAQAENSSLGSDIDGSTEFRATPFSDNIVLSARHSESGVFRVLDVAASLTAALMWRGFVCRGAVATGLLVHSEALLFGPGLIRAYELEQKAAIYPRIIVMDELCPRKYSAHWRLRQDSDGFWFIDVFDRIRRTTWVGHDRSQNLFRIRDRILLQLRQARNIGALDVLAKHRWLAAKFNEFVAAEMNGQVIPIEIEEAV